jgi:outer membrane protein assembly factor BamB
LAGLIGAVLLLGAWMGTPASLAQESGVGTGWPALQGGPEHLGTFGTQIEPPLKQAWQLRPSGDPRFSMPVIASGLGIGVGTSSVVGFDPTSGRTLWTVPRKPGPLLPGVLAPVPSPSGSSAGLGAAGGSSLFIYVEGRTGQDAALVAIDAADHSPRWRTPLGDLTRSAPQVADGVVYLGCRDGNLYAIDLATGKVLWKAAAAGRDLDTSPAVAGGRVFIVGEEAASGRATLYAFPAKPSNTASVKPLWTYSPTRFAIGVNSPTVAGGTVYVGLGDLTVRAFSAATGKQIWSTPVRGDFSGSSSFAVDGSSVYAIDREGGVYALDTSDGTRRWDYQFPAFALQGAPFASGRTVYAAYDNGLIVAIDMRSGHLTWRGEVRSQDLGAFAPAGDLLLMASQGAGGGIFAYRNDPDGTLLDVPSPTELKLGVALLSYVAAFAIALVAILGFFRLLEWARRTRAA